ncbi:MAG: hypothetical protein WA071_01965 [Undibacterium umbellatum]
MNVTAPNANFNTSPSAAVQPPSGHGATVPANEQAPAPAQQQPGDIKG